jgi:hypothetical protein
MAYWSQTSSLQKCHRQVSVMFRHTVYGIFKCWPELTKKMVFLETLTIKQLGLALWRHCHSALSSRLGWAPLSPNSFFYSCIHSTIFTCHAPYAQLCCARFCRSHSYEINRPDLNLTEFSSLVRRSTYEEPCIGM